MSAGSTSCRRTLVHADPPDSGHDLLNGLVDDLPARGLGQPVLVEVIAREVQHEHVTLDRHRYGALQDGAEYGLLLHDLGDDPVPRRFEIARRLGVPNRIARARELRIVAE